MQRQTILSLIAGLALSVGYSGVCGAALLQEQPTIEKSIPDRVLKAPEKKVVSIVVENDAFGAGTDGNYTSGVRVNVTSLQAKLPPIVHKMDSLIPTFRLNKTSSVYYSLGQNIYTPSDITQVVADPDDRPWAAFLYGSVGLVTLTDNHTDEVEATLGVVGPMAMGKLAQKLVHKKLGGSPDPKGWSNQLKNEPGFMLAWQRGWPMALNGRMEKNFWAVKPYFGLTAGNIRTYGSTGFTVSLTPDESKWQDTPIRVRPAMPGTGLYEIPVNKWSWSLFAGAEGRAVARDIFLDGNTFTSSHSVDKKPFVADVTGGASLTYNNLRLSYTTVYRAREFEEQDHPEVFGAFSLAVRF